MISLEHVCIGAGSFRLTNVSFTVADNLYCVLMGATGSGKTTILEAICGLRKIIYGKILLNGRNITDCPPAQRGIGYVPQDGALFSTMTVAEHLAFALRLRHWDSDRINQRVSKVAKDLKINQLLHRYPQGLSGGERQRVSLGRALTFSPSVLCFDEPLSALDEKTHTEICELLHEVHQQSKVTILHVTHSQKEAEHLADQILRMEQGRVVVQKFFEQEALTSNDA